MLIEAPKILPKDLSMPCYACEKQPATHVCRYTIGEMVIQVCLCPDCMKIDTKRLLNNTVGLQGVFDQPPGNYVVRESTPKAEPQPSAVMA